MEKVIKGIILNPRNDKSLEILNPGFLVFDQDGIIKEVSSDKNILKKYKGCKVLDFKKNLIIPGLVDLHNHIPQYSFAGMGSGQLLDWLKEYTFPAEHSFADKTVAKNRIKLFFKDLIKNGTTTTVSYVTVHKSATDLAFSIAKKIGIRAFMGQVLMDQNSPKNLIQDLNMALKETEYLIEKWHNNTDRLHYVITPRFAITSSFKIMTQISKLQKKYNTYVQTHLAENLEELKTVKKLYPDFLDYTDVYSKSGILNNKTILAHSIYLSQKELEVIKKSGAHIAHCPTSNRFLRSGIMPVRKYLDFNLNMGLGSDVAGGYSLSMFDQIKEAIENSKILSLFDNKNNSEPLSLAQAFYLATLGGAKALGQDDKIGSFEKNKIADFVLVDPSVIDPMGKDSCYDNPLQLLSKVIYRNNENMIKNVFIKGKSVFKFAKD